ncbi:BTB/POZ and MATH domain-containing protein 2 [Dichanthelium oligosanthes]|uniref:BTB/POZ and MATH domain-containing protein 2 n=1 Tax=Dichanthelium oligosanthes TaxID=888268 RepID=A0A1E5VLZ7_9POAL|nr:BTB/POZ and MATH domain-containing protein 2 [Dichanthelium oligosanthes]
MTSASRKTASRCTTEAARGMHVFQIVGYSLKWGLGVGKFVSSRTFTVGGYDWAIRFYPDGLTASSREYVSIYLELVSKNAEVRACYSLGLIDQTSQTTGIQCSRKFPRLFKSWDATRFGPQQEPEFILRTELEENHYVRDDCLTIEYNLTVTKESQLSDIRVNSEIEVPPCDIPEHFAKLLDQKDGAGVTFDVAGEIIEAHKIILAARSPVFKAQFYGHMRETMMGHVTIKDMQPVIFKALLRFIYTGSVHSMGDDLDGDDYRDMLWHLLVAADRYAMDRLKLICQNILSKNLHVETVAATLALANQHKSEKLKEVCIEFITTNDTNAVVATQRFANLKRACPSVLAEILEKTSKHRKA